MPWQTPKTDWNASNVVTPADMNRIEGNISELKKAATIDIADAGGNFVATNVEDALQELAGNVQTGKNTIASAITAMGQSASGTETFDSLASKIRAISTDATAAVADVLAGKTFYAAGSKKTGTMPNRGAVVITPGTANVAIPAGYHNGSGYVLGDPDLIAANIRKGVSIFGVTGALPVVPWFYDFSAFTTHANWNASANAPAQSTAILLSVTGKGWITYLRAITDGYDSRQWILEIDGVDYPFPTWLDYTGQGSLVAQPIRFESGFRVKYVNNAATSYSVNFAYTYLKEIGTPDDTKHAILAKQLRAFRAYQHGLNIAGSGYLLAFSQGGKTSDGTPVTVTIRIDGTTLPTPSSNQFMALGPVRFSSSLSVDVPNGFPWKEVLYVLD